MAYSSTPTAPATGSTSTPDGQAVIAGLTGAETFFQVDVLDAAGNVIARTSVLDPFGAAGYTPLLTSELNPDKAAFAGLDLRPLLIKIVNALGSGSSSGTLKVLGTGGTTSLLVHSTTSY